MDKDKIIADLTTSLKQALRYIEVSTAYQGSMTAAQVEERIRQNKDISATQIGANSVSTLATFSFTKARAALKAATEELGVTTGCTYPDCKCIQYIAQGVAPECKQGYEANDALLKEAGIVQSGA
jgi:hypothetical protein